ncbi:extracellular solute-binding protein [Bifidobacterium sp. SMB2]|uniref:Extracellular solute-binding protein n=1 Tax=Bifidobacterium saimiriisciurei TaxID=2661627 RepID=A0ABX0CA06_9BIFI|nr:MULTISPECIES: extracellular solute-binding protein [Bifidobacterium]NEG96511.1 extracellular solute-binding protein [Bifidobacterium sp. SMB2]NEH10572.1 extracellular solute-binding protein [Bifidobacterium saimiriisciurei]NEH10645.1 extracellular solute-binding protein [Bifidobacterium saimiriisciurei]
MNKRWMKIAVSAVAAVGLLAPLAACGGSSSGSSTSNGPVTIEWWGWDQGQKKQADEFNKSQSKIKVVYKQQASQEKAEQALVNAVKAGNAPDLTEVNMDSTISLLADGTLQNVKQYNPDLSKISKQAVDSFTVGDQLAVIPYKVSPQFMIVNQKTLDAAGVKAPTTWDEMIAAGKALKAKNKDIKLINLPGEDPSQLVLMAQQFGAKWYSTKGDKWVVDINGPETKKAAAYLQQIVDNDMFSQKTYVEWDALMQYFQSGNLATVGTSTWQLSAYQQNFSKSLGDWHAVAWPKESAGSDVVTPLNAQGNGVPKGAKNPQAAVEFATWLATNDTAIKTAANAQTGSGAFPAVTDASKYVKDSLPDKLLDDNDDAAKVVEEADKTLAPYTTGVNWSSMFKQLQDQWAQFTQKKITADQMLDNVQAWTVKDLKDKGISVESAN